MVLGGFHIQKRAITVARHNDTFAAGAALSVTGLVQYYANTTIADFPELSAPGTSGSVPAALSLYSGTIQPANWSSVGALPHQISVSPAPSGAGYVISQMQPGP